MALVLSTRWLGCAKTQRRTAAPAAAQERQGQRTRQQQRVRRQRVRLETKVAIVAPASIPSWAPFPRGADFSSVSTDVAVNREGEARALWGDVGRQIAHRVEWAVETGAVTAVSVDAHSEKDLKHLADADVVLACGFNEADEAVSAAVLGACSCVPTLLCPDAPKGSPLHAAARVEFAPLSVSEHSAIGLLPWTRASKDAKLVHEVASLYARHTPLDLCYLILLVVSHVGEPVAATAAHESLGLGGLLCIAKNCGDVFVDCLQTPECKRTLDCLDECGLNDQVCSYACVRSYETPQFTKFATCFMHKHNCMNNNATPPTLPPVSSITEWRGERMTHQLALQIYGGWRYDEENPDPDGISWRVCAGQNAAYDRFPCQYQIFYYGKARGSFWYQPVFKIDTDDGRSEWRVSDYRVRQVYDAEPGVVELTFSDNGVVSREIWRIMGAADDLSWALFYYQGAAATAGQSYSGAVLGTRTGEWPTDMQGVHEALSRCSIEAFEMYSVNWKSCGDAPLETIHAENASRTKTHILAA